MHPEFARYALLMVQLGLAAYQVGYAFDTRTGWSVGSALFLVLLAIRAILIDVAAADERD